MVVYGPVVEAGASYGLAVFRAASPEEARVLAAADPAVSSGMATCEVGAMPGQSCPTSRARRTRARREAGQRPPAANRNRRRTSDERRTPCPASSSTFSTRTSRSARPHGPPTAAAAVQLHGPGPIGRLNAKVGLKITRRGRAPCGAPTCSPAGPGQRALGLQDRQQAHHHRLDRPDLPAARAAAHHHRRPERAGRRRRRPLGGHLQRCRRRPRGGQADPGPPRRPGSRRSWRSWGTSRPCRRGGRRRYGRLGAARVWGGRVVEPPQQP